MNRENEETVDPVYRCDSCQKLILLTKIHKLGYCNHCGNKRFIPVNVLSDKEQLQLRELKIPQSFFDLFQEVSDEE